MNDHPHYEYHSAEPSWGNQYLWPPLAKLLSAHLPHQARVFELGCGNGAIAGKIAALGFEVTAIDTSESGISQAASGNPGVTFAIGSAYDDLAGNYGTFDAVVSLEVVEHLFSPRTFAHSVSQLLNPGGVALISTPYHGYLKNLFLALTGKLEAHWDPLWDGGHIKFWSKDSLTRLLTEQNLTVESIYPVGRVPPLAKSMIAVAKRGSADRSISPQQR
ncbi:MAG: class I SAM-dependent methyltransferase [Lysobacterales bacterium]